MSKCLLGAFFFLSLFFERSFAIGTNFEEGTAKVNMVLGVSDLVSASVETIDPPNGYAYSKAYMWGGDETSPPKKIIKVITVLRNGKKILIPLSAYADLGNPTEVYLKKLPSHGFRLILQGGDAAGSYRAILDFKEDEIFHRKVVSGEFPKEVWEETVFSFNHLNN